MYIQHQGNIDIVKMKEAFKIKLSLGKPIGVPIENVDGRQYHAFFLILCGGNSCPLFKT